MKQIGVLAVLFVVLLAGVIVKETSRPDAGSLRDQVPLQRLGPAAFTADDVATVEIAGPAGADPFRVVREGDVWVVDAAFRAPAAAAAVDRLLEAVVAARGELRLDDTAALAKFDLTPERAASVVLRNAAGTALADFSLGRSSGTQGAFVRPRHDGVRDGAYAVSQDLRGALGLTRTRPGDAPPETPDAAHFHDLALPNLALEDTTRVELESPGWKVVFEKAGAEWAAVEGAPDLPLRPSGVRQLVQTLAGALNATSLTDPARRAELGLDAPAYRVTAVLADGSRRTALGAANQADQKFHVRLDVERDPDAVYECTRYAWERLFPPGSQLFEFASLGVENKGLGQVRIEGTSEPFAMTRPGGSTQAEWSVVAPAWHLPPRDAQLRGYVTLLNGVRPVDWYGGDEPFREEAVVRYGAEEDTVDALTTLRIGQAAPSGTGRLAILANAPERIVVLPDTTVERLVPDLMTLFEERPLSGAVPADVTGVTVRDLVAENGAAAPLFELARDADGKWSVTWGDSTSTGDTNAVASWLDDLAQVEVLGRASDDVPTLFEIEVRRGEQVTTLGFSAAKDGERTLRVDGVAFRTDADTRVPAATTFVAAEGNGENPGSAEEEDDGE